MGSPEGRGCFLRSTPNAKSCYLEIPLGGIVGLERFVCCHRYSPFWLKPVVGRLEADVPAETLWILAHVSEGRYLLIVPLLDGPNRYSLSGTSGSLTVVVETGASEEPCTQGTSLFVAEGECPYTLISASSDSVAKFFATGGLRKEKAVPDFVDLFGWCTWDAFYKSVSADKVTGGLEYFREGGISLPLLILDDGWQSWELAESGEELLTSLAPNERFGGDLSVLVNEAKRHHGVRRFLVWHAFMGYWGGICPQALPGYDAVTRSKSFGPGILSQNAKWNIEPWGAQITRPSPSGITKFYEDYHSALAAQGVDGVKVDAQALLESVSGGEQGRVASAKGYREALDRSVNFHFDGRLINCMSSTSECAYLAKTAVMRSSDDFLPLVPESHGMHLYTNAHVGLWFGEFMLLDWDMFQSSHGRGSFHAAARAISGGPVYVSDKSGDHDFSILHRLVLSDGTILRSEYSARPTLDCLFFSPNESNAPFKIFNINGDCGVVGVFNLNHDPLSGSSPVAGSVSIADIPHLKGEGYVGFLYQQDHLWKASRGVIQTITLHEGGWELVSFAPVEHGFAALGLSEKYNSTAAIDSRRWRGTNQIIIVVRDGGRFLAWSEREPCTVNVQNAQVNFEYNPVSGRLEFQIGGAGMTTITVSFT